MATRDGEIASAQANASPASVKPRSGGRSQSDFICAAKVDALFDQ
jgi:hypothetical protein